MSGEGLKKKDEMLMAMGISTADGATAVAKATAVDDDWIAAARRRLQQMGVIRR